ncbi:MAG: S-layer homology domain-containing protein [Cyanobacteria bacterium P01_G01_bin.38]
MLRWSQLAAVGLMVSISLVSCGRTSEETATAPVLDAAEESENVSEIDASDDSLLVEDEAPDEVIADELAVETGLIPSDIEQVPSPNKEMILDLATLGVFEEMGEDFKLLDPITRGQFLKLLYYANNAVRDSERHIRLAPVFDPEFSDINEEHPAYQFVQAFASAGYSVGYQDGTFKPDQVLTREELVGIKVPVDSTKIRSIPSNYDRIKEFNDVDQISEEFAEYIYHDTQVDGEQGGNIDRAFGSVKSFKPAQPVLGYEAAAAMWEFAQPGSVSDTAVEAIESLAEQ